MKSDPIRVELGGDIIYIEDISKKMMEAIAAVKAEIREPCFCLNCSEASGISTTVIINFKDVIRRMGAKDPRALRAALTQLMGQSPASALGIRRCGFCNVPAGNEHDSACPLNIGTVTTPRPTIGGQPPTKPTAAPTQGATRSIPSPFTPGFSYQVDKPQRLKADPKGFIGSSNLPYDSDYD